jgi:valyl-tRNA synthetase
VIERFPEVRENLVEEESEREMEVIKGVIETIRKIRGEVNIQPNVKVEAYLKADGRQELLLKYAPYIMELAKVKDIKFGEKEIKERCAIDVAYDVEIYIPLEDIIDVKREISRIEKEMRKLDEELEKIFKKMNNRDFLGKAPPEVIEKNREIMEELKNKRLKLASSRKRLGALR